MRRTAEAAVPVAVSATNRSMAADRMGWASILLFLVIVAALVAAGAIAYLM